MIEDELTPDTKKKVIDLLVECDKSELIDFILERVPASDLERFAIVNSVPDEYYEAVDTMLYGMSHAEVVSMLIATKNPEELEKMLEEVKKIETEE